MPMQTFALIFGIAKRCFDDMCMYGDQYMIVRVFARTVQARVGAFGIPTQDVMASS